MTPNLLLQRDRRALARTMTMLESTKTEDRLAALECLNQLPPMQAKRIGISGPPGVGKSTFIEALGRALTQRGELVGVLAVDPSSPLSGGSILGDKTRMQELAADERAFIRPSPAGTHLGGVARCTQDCSLLLERTGYHWILIETVGVGQSEFKVAQMVDLFIGLAQPHAGDELQGIKRGILELTDLLVVTKADGDTLEAAKRTLAIHEHALHLARGASAPKVLTHSMYQDIGPVLQMIETCLKGQSDRRREQSQKWMEEALLIELVDHMRAKHHVEFACSEFEVPSLKAMQLAKQILSGVE